MPEGIAAGAISYCTENDSVVSPNDQPASNAARFAARISGLLANFLVRNSRVPSAPREYSHDSSPSAYMFFARSASFFVRSNDFSASTVCDVSATACTLNSSSEPSSMGFDVKPTFSRLRLVNSSVFRIRSAPRGRSLMFAFRAAGFIATRTFGASPGVVMS